VAVPLLIAGVVLLALRLPQTAAASNVPSRLTRPGPSKPSRPVTSPGPTGSSGSTAPTGSGGSTGTTSASIAVPTGLTPPTTYTHLVENFEFGGATLPSGWSSGDSNYGFQATLFQPSQVVLSAFSVALTASPVTGSAAQPYISGWISTQSHYTLTHGMIDFRVWVPAGTGLWPAMWLCNGTNAEIDVAELLMNNPSVVYGSLHSTAWGETQSVTLPTNLSGGYHDYEVVWQPGMVTWAVDGVAYAQYTKANATAAHQTWPFDTASGVYLIADLAVGAADEWPGAPNAATPFPAAMQLQYVRVWQ
jgi:beta-glucanase (GH16 family)